MNKLLYILLFMLVAGTVSCHRTSEAEARLIAIDSLIPAAPDSAISLLEAIDTASLRGEMRAYHALLTAQALYKAYIPATSDSLINLAWDYYKDHGSYDRRIRAMLYKATTAEELGHPEEAMRWYKRTELESRTDDHYHRGYALMAMGKLYQFYYDSKHAITKYLLSIKENEQISDTLNLLFCYCQLSNIYQLELNDSSSFFLSKLDALSRIAKDTVYIVATKSNKATKYYNDFDYVNAKNIAVDVIERFGSYSPINCWYYAAISYAKLGEKDSALYYFNELTTPKNVKDSILYYEVLKSLCELNDDWNKVHIFDSISSEISESKIDKAFSNSMFQSESKVEHQWLKKHHENKLKLIITIVLIITCLAGIVVFFKRLQWRRDLTKMRVFIEELENQKNSLSDNNITLNNEIENLQNSIGSLSDVFRTILTAVRKSSGTQLDKTIKTLLTESFFSHIYQYVDYTHPELIEEMKSSESLSKRDIDIVCLYLCHLPDSVIQIYADLSNIRSVNKLKKTIAVKLRESKDASIEHLRRF